MADKRNLKDLRFESGGVLGPGPAAYKLPTSIGYDYEGTPGKKVERHVPNMYSFGLRPPEKNSTLGPGPIPNSPPPKAGAYTEMVTRHGKPPNYKYSFGLRPPPLTQDKVPSPVDCQPDQAKMPPAQYEKIQRLTVRSGPEYSFGNRHADLRKDPGPGPNVYFPPDKDTKLMPDILHVYKNRAPRFILNSRPNERIEYTSPGAAGYHPFLQKDAKGNVLDRVDPVRPQAPQYTMRGARYDIDKRVSPGPAAYDISKVKSVKVKGNLQPTAIDGKRAPAWPFGQRRRAPPMIIPGDNC